MELNKKKLLQARFYPVIWCDFAIIFRKNDIFLKKVSKRFGSYLKFALSLHPLSH